MAESFNPTWLANARDFHAKLIAHLRYHRERTAYTDGCEFCDEDRRAATAFNTPRQQREPHAPSPSTVSPKPSNDDA